MEGEEEIITMQVAEATEEATTKDRSNEKNHVSFA
jgi:hypothetical protein